MLSASQLTQTDTTLSPVCTHAYKQNRICFLQASCNHITSVHSLNPNALQLSQLPSLPICCERILIELCIFPASKFIILFPPIVSVPLEFTVSSFCFCPFCQLLNTQRLLFIYRKCLSAICFVNFIHFISAISKGTKIDTRPQLC